MAGWLYREDAIMRLDIGQIEVVDEQLAEVLRQKTPAERLAMADAIWVLARDRMRAEVQQEHPEWDDECVQLEVARKILQGEVDEYSVTVRDVM